MSAEQDVRKCIWGNTGSVAIAAGADLFWQVDLEAIFTITEVRVRADNLDGLSHFTNVQIMVCTDGNGQGCTNCGGMVTGTANQWLVASCSNTNGRYVRFAIEGFTGHDWHFCFVDVYGFAPSLQTP